jgi:hypothetical protein
MTWHDDLPIEIAATFRALSGGYMHTRNEEACWQMRLRHREGNRAWFHDFMSRRPDRQRVRAWGKAAKLRARTRVVAQRFCRVCRQPYELTAWDRSNGRRCRLSTCSRQCGLLASGRHELHEINGERRTLRGWCLELGMAEGTVHHRVNSLGMSVIAALTTPKMPAGRRARGPHTKGVDRKP